MIRSTTISCFVELMRVRNQKQVTPKPDVYTDARCLSRNTMPSKAENISGTPEHPSRFAVPDAVFVSLQERVGRHVETRAPPINIDPIIWTIGERAVSLPSRRDGGREASCFTDMRVGHGAMS